MYYRQQIYIVKQYILLTNIKRVKVLELLIFYYRMEESIMTNKNIKTTLALGIGCFVIVSIVLRLLKPFIFSGQTKDLENFPFHYIGIVLLIFSAGLFLYERWHGFAFAYAYAKNWGGNGLGGFGNSFFILGIALMFFEMTTIQFAAVMIVTSVLLLTAGIVINRHVKKA